MFDILPFKNGFEVFNLQLFSRIKIHIRTYTGKNCFIQIWVKQKSTE